MFQMVRFQCLELAQFKFPPTILGCINFYWLNGMSEKYNFHFIMLFMPHKKELMQKQFTYLAHKIFK